MEWFGWLMLAVICLGVLLALGIVYVTIDEARNILKDLRKW